MLLDHYAPQWSFAERHQTPVRADAPRLVAAILAYRPENDRLFRFLIGLREAPMRLGRKLTGSTKPLPEPFGLDNFTLLEQTATELVYGLVGRFWRADFDLVEIADGAAFRAHQQPGVPKLALGFRIEGAGAERRLVTETRVFCPDAASRRAFTPYWYLIRPVSGLIRRRILASIRTASET